MKKMIWFKKKVKATRRERQRERVEDVNGWGLVVMVILEHSCSCWMRV